jgi:hypothetical protein
MLVAMKPLFNSAGLTTAVLLFLAAESPANLVVNGNFEGTTYTDGTTGDVLPSGWTLGPPSPANLSKVNVSSNVDVATDLGPANGTYFLRFQSPATNGTRDCVLQDLTTVAGQPYMISFSVAITSPSVSNSLGLSPVWDENRANQTIMGSNEFYYSPTNTGPVAYQSFLFIETASASVTRIDFHGIDVNGSILVDSVVVLPFSPPAIQSVTLTNNTFGLAWTTVSGAVYQVEYTPSLTGTNWLNIGGTLTAAGSTLSATATVGNAAQRFYRIQLVP